MYLVLVTNTLARGGAEAMLSRLALSLDRSRVSPVVACLREPGVWGRPLAEHGIPIYQNILRHKYDFLAIRRLCRIVRQHRPACIMAVGSGGDRMFWSTLAGRAAGSPVVVWSHLFPVPGVPEFEWINRRLYPWVNAFVALGSRHAEALAHAAGAPTRRICVIRNGIDVDALDLPRERERVRYQLGLGSGHVAVGMVANLRPIKRVGQFIEAAGRASVLRPEARFFVVGEGPQRAELESQIARLGGLGANIQLVGARDDVSQLLQAFDIVCLTSERECLSVAMLEAMAAGKAFVAPRVGSLDEAVVDGETGRFYEPHTAEGLAGMLTELIDDRDQRERLGMAAREKVRSEFRIEQMARAFEALVTRLVDEG